MELIKAFRATGFDRTWFPNNKRCFNSTVVKSGFTSWKGPAVVGRVNEVGVFCHSLVP